MILLAAGFAVHIQHLMATFPDVDEHIADLYKMSAVAARYGHQQLSEIGDLRIDQLRRLNSALGALIDKENEAGAGLVGRRSTGGG